ncbi:peptidase domain-containing ABC transporter [Shewanella oneidensis]|uniref:ABC-type bacteriocin export system multifunctional permease/ATPase/protease component n=1 Tax=Shewanella oneidensis (strain ATCC 700550 / JCM 31522 / CIP 106686 / LMG 19005 / NCIMB 14063 / MR-1) TaxID=211586 RepID=Q8E874_SHEON|nr:peptidase domain-containing ABC transporter [Shewanella oneidensis]AAN52985.1 ABC-type bacteriocin export system multifunctional permease/ATPase/protease component [Shewanella oneidensis MR-1]MDX5999768.1 peptidase domain-containing ABC transporter [Shewanella oneidensis]MEE2030023.1 Toxin RTX-I translocation ATP-binding protein [Shewanella oneidensis]
MTIATDKHAALMASESNSPVDLLEFSGNKRVPLILQAEMAECGLACMAMIASFNGHKLDMAALRKRFTANLKGMNLQQLISLGDSIGLSSRALKCPLEEVGKLALPCILHWDMNHFVVLTGVTKKSISINDPAAGKRTLSLQEFAKHFTGIALELTPTKAFVKQDERQQMRLSQLWTKISGVNAALITLLLLSVLLQVFALVTPYYMQWVVDEVLVSQDQPLLIVLAIGFGLLVVINVFTTGVRSWLVLRVSSLLNMQMGVNLLRHLLRLPMNYFEKRHIGDLVSRFGSLAQVRERLTTGLVETVVDGVMSIAVLVMMLIYSVKLTLVVMAAVALYTLMRFALYRPLHRATEESIQAKAKEQSNFLENIRGIQTIKLFTCESARQGIWQNRYSEVINADIRLGRLKISFDAMNKLLFGVENIIVIYMAAMIVMSGGLTIGMVLAFIAYKNQMTERVASLIEQLIMFRMLRLHLDRISDIALHEQEAHQEGFTPLNVVKGRLSLENVSFRYGENEPEVVSNLSLDIQAGESVAIVGASGCGKTTLVKLMLGLLVPSSGRILLDGQAIQQIGLTQYRQQIAAVMQDDTLLSGSIADNITFFDPEPNYVKMQQCAQLAVIDMDIAHMPMGYNSLVGDMGNQFSGGQVQRLLLARALYQSPSILFMDEATSHLDIMNEAKISEQIKNLNMTRIIIAHRPETIKQADRVVVMHQGKIMTAEELQQAQSAS